MHILPECHRQCEYLLYIEFPMVEEGPLSQIPLTLDSLNRDYWPYTVVPLELLPAIEVPKPFPPWLSPSSLSASS